MKTSKTCATAVMGGFLLATAFSGPQVKATTGKGCLRIVGMPAWDSLNLRAAASANARIVRRITPDTPGVLSLRGTCKPGNQPWAARWCPVSHSNEHSTVNGFVKARFVRDQECP